MRPAVFSQPGIDCEEDVGRLADKGSGSSSCIRMRR
jgi:hypothetical protein